MLLKIIPIFAEYFICWWITLFMVLPIGLQTQAETDEVVQGTVKSAPAHFRFWRVFLITTAVSAVIYTVWYMLTVVYGVSAMSFTSFMPDFRND